MLAIARSGVALGVEAFPVAVETDVAQGLPAFTVVGLAEGAVRESRERVKSAIKNCGYPFPTRKITVNLAPADLKKDAAGLDLPMAAAVLAAGGVVPPEALDRYCLVGELSLDGSVKPARGVLPLAMAARKWQVDGLVVPAPNAREGAVVGEVPIFPVEHLSQVVDFLRGAAAIAPVQVDPATLFSDDGREDCDFQDVVGQEHAKRAIEVAAAGGHNILMVGPPGSGKTMLARRLPTILPPLAFTEALETTSVYSVAGLLDPHQALVTRRPFRAPHHTISDAGLIGGGTHPRPGEVSLAHNGVLFLDELPEFRKNALESLRQPLEDGFVTISRVSQTLTFPARVTLVCSQNPCPCGYYGDPQRPCTCHPREVHRYRRRISGPLLDRIDIQIEVPAVPYRDLARSRRGEPSAEIRRRVLAARERQHRRFAGLPLHCNAQMGAREVRRFCRLETEALSFLEEASRRLHLSARAFHRIQKIARTIADLEAAPDIRLPHVAEAVQYRSLDRGDGAA
ncbi:YifB family Mg chelatase-like AAA ATPase [Dissulfurirhabdus thermomarina]|uniref:YifB family Mg chelatase-like AAA ATPase n=1 Tax=Dissulfurirhabdus thermomarina TaxID=1765737 RepID=A0A6N9TM15_DISTH|nr:YifB family Mg chelatase-like AAA ATPase [Dissulfurirhabdus thermomarina]NDY42159.1 YifB family Mg chelatase-like AAA ATPase [Dissulfurirhabdus thermomarina]NMX22411.1 YifB family Mg chelatase-like AAA ATPase [Dissulfurirhabdus thermomarina]